MRNAYKMSVNLKGRDYSEDLGVYVRNLLEWTLSKQGGKVWIGFVWLRIETCGWIL
jgi:hypothetical protein